MPPTALPAALDRRLSPRQRDLLLRAWPFLAPGAFVGGFGVDLVTLRRVDDLGDNLQLTLYLVASALLLLLERRAWHGRACPGLVRDHRGVARLGLQFLFGGLFSAYVIFYSQSATVGPSMLFCLLLALLMLGNELWFERLRPDLPQVALWFFCALSYLLFAVPTWTGQLGPATRLAAALLAVGAGLLLVVGIHLGPVVELAPPRTGRPVSLGRAVGTNLGTWAVMLCGLWLLVKLGAVPPVPLALAEAGVFHDVRREGGDIVLTYDAPPWWAPWRTDDRRFAFAEGDRVFVYTAVFAPVGAGVEIQHAWERQESDGSWTETDRIPFTMTGGREGGWRSWTAKRQVTPGRWRVRVLSEHGDRLGRVDLEILLRQGDPPEQRARIR